MPLDEPNILTLNPEDTYTDRKLKSILDHYMKKKLDFTIRIHKDLNLMNHPSEVEREDFSKKFEIDVEENNSISKDDISRWFRKYCKGKEIKDRWQLSTEFKVEPVVIITSAFAVAHFLYRVYNR